MSSVNPNYFKSNFWQKLIIQLSVINSIMLTLCCTALFIIVIYLISDFKVATTRVTEQSPNKVKPKEFH